MVANEGYVVILRKNSMAGLDRWLDEGGFMAHPVEGSPEYERNIVLKESDAEEREVFGKVIDLGRNVKDVYVTSWNPELSNILNRAC